MVCVDALRTERRYSRNLSIDGFIGPHLLIIGTPGRWRALRNRAVSRGERQHPGRRPRYPAFQALTATGASSLCGLLAGLSSINFSQSHPSLTQARTMPILLFFSTMNGAPHFGHGSAIGIFGEVKSQSG